MIKFAHRARPTRQAGRIRLFVPHLPAQAGPQMQYRNMRPYSMNIAIFTDAFPPQINGVVSYVLDLATVLIKIGHNVTVFAPKPKRNFKLDLTTYPFQVILLPSLPALFYPDLRITIPSLPKILYELRKFRPDVIHVQDPFSVGSEGLMAAKIINIPTVITFHTFFMDEKMLENLKVDVKIAAIVNGPIWHLTSYYHNLADVIICPTHNAQDELRKHGLKKPSVVIPHGINLSFVKQQSKKEIDTKRKELGLKSDDLVGIYVGRLAADKSIDILIKSWKKVVNKIPAAKLLIIGSGPFEHDLKFLARQLKISGNVYFAGEMDRKELLNNGYLQVGNLAVTASKIENPSYSLLESMAYGLPVVGVAMRGIPEIVDDKNGILVPPDDLRAFACAVIDIFENKEKFKKLSLGSKIKIKSFDINKTIKQLEKIYSELITQSKYTNS